MKEFAFSVPQDIVFGVGSVRKLPELLQKSGVDRVLVISGPHLNKMGVVKQITDLIASSGIRFETFTETEANPSIETVNAATELFLRNGANGLVALGGGSPIDTAKAVGALAAFGGKITDYEGAQKIPGKITPLIAIPTTAGTGSEVTGAAVITDRSRNYKFPITSVHLIPKAAILDPALIMSLPAGIAAATGVDAIVHALEAYISKAASPFSDAMAEKALELIGGNIRAFVKDRSNEEAACAMLAGSTFAGISFLWGKLGDVHAMALPLGGFFNIAHGIAVAVLLPVIVEFNAAADTGKYEKIYRYIAENPATEFKPELLAGEIRKLNESLGIPKNLSELGVDPAKIPDMAGQAMKSGNIPVNPVETTIEDVKTLYHQAM